MENQLSIPDRIVLNIISAGFGSGMTYELRSPGMFGGPRTTYTAYRQELLMRPSGCDDIIEIDNNRPFDSLRLHAIELDDLFKTLRRVQVPILATNKQGFDGAYYNLRVFQDAGYVSVYSWCVPSRELFDLHEFQRQFIDTLDRLLSTATRKNAEQSNAPKPPS